MRWSWAGCVGTAAAPAAAGGLAAPLAAGAVAAGLAAGGALLGVLQAAATSSAATRNGVASERMVLFLFVVARYSLAVVTRDAPHPPAARPASPAGRGNYGA